jgi:2-C-methyl-D-erythritol 4-phosphate cytidylyltransferase
MEKGKRIGAVILAGGQGKRMNSPVQKQYMMLVGRPVITYALEVFSCLQVDEIVLVVGAGELEYVREQILKPYGPFKVTAVTEGGRERYHSVYEGLKALSSCDYVLIHDGARPLISEDIILRAIRGAVAHEACAVGMPVKDTIKVIDTEGFAAETPDRSLLWQIQTPQAFSYPLIRQAYEKIMSDEKLQSNITDDAMIVEKWTSRKVKMIEGSYENLKVTTPDDLVLAEALLQRKT